MNRIVLIQPPVRDFYLTRKRTLPYGLASIAADLEEAGFSCTLIDGLATDKSKAADLPGIFSYLEPFYGRPDLSHFSLFSTFRHFGYAHGHLAHLTRKENPFLVGISSLFTPYADQAMATAAAVKKFCPDAWVVLGGHHPTAFPDHCLASPDVDFVIRGEGETALARLCTFLKEGGFSAGPASRQRSWSGIPGITALPGLAFRGDGEIISNKPHWIENLDTLPLPAIEKTCSKFYRRRGKSSVTIAASRGCPFGCTYCSVSARSGHGRFRRRSVEHILAEIRCQAEHGDVGFIDFEDENLTLDKGWALALLTGIREIFGSKAVELRAMNGLYPPSLDREIIRAMKEAGFTTLNLSVGSFSLDQLKQFGRPDVRKAHAEVLEMAREMGMASVTYIIGAGPGQTADTTLNDLVTLAVLPTLAGLSIFYPAPGSVAWDQCREKGLLPETFELMRSSALPLDHGYQNKDPDRGTSRLEAVTLLRLSRIVNFLKFLADSGKGLPPALSFSQTDAERLSHRMGSEDGSLSPALRTEISTRLVQWFLADGMIRGMDDRGSVYEHNIDSRLCRKFLRRMRQSGPFMGVTTGPWSFPEH